MEPPFVDEHAVVVDASQDEVWRALLAYADATLTSPGPMPRRLFTRLLGTDPPAGFASTVEEPRHRLRLTGRHRFSRYVLAFEVTPVGERTRLAALTYAAFPGPHGFAYRTLVIRSHAHAVLTRRMLQAVARWAEGRD